LRIRGGYRQYGGRKDIPSQIINNLETGIERGVFKNGNPSYQKEKDDDRPYHFAPVIFQVKFYHCLQVVF